VCQVLAQKGLDAADVRAALKQGAPDALRLDLWRLALGVAPLDPGQRDAMAAERSSMYQSLVAELCSDIKDGGVPVPGVDPFPIDADVRRTMPTMHFYASLFVATDLPSHAKPSADTAAVASDASAGPSPAAEEELAAPAASTRIASRLEEPPFTPTQLALRRVLFLFARAHRGRGYLQGMNEMAGLILWAFSNGHAADVPTIEADAFFCFQRLMQIIGDALSSVTDHTGVDGVNTSLQAYEALLYTVDPQLAAHFAALGLVPEYYAFRWITVLMVVDLPLADVLPLWDFFLSWGEDLPAAAIAVAVAVVVAQREDLLALTDCGLAIQMLQDLQQTDEFNADFMAKDAVVILDRYTTKRDAWEKAMVQATRDMSRRQGYNRNMGDPAPMELSAGERLDNARQAANEAAHKLKESAAVQAEQLKVHAENLKAHAAEHAAAAGAWLGGAWGSLKARVAAATTAKDQGAGSASGSEKKAREPAAEVAAAVNEPVQIVQEEELIDCVPVSTQ
jgi:hypothetical protein